MSGRLGLMLRGRHYSFNDGRDGMKFARALRRRGYKVATATGGEAVYVDITTRALTALLADELARRISPTGASVPAHD